MIDPKPRDINPIHLILLHKSLVNSGGKNPSVLGTKPPVIGETPPHTRSKSPTWNAKPPFLGWFPLHKTRRNYHFTSCGHPCEAAKFALNGYFSTLNMALFWSKMQIITATVLQGGTNHILDLYYVDTPNVTHSMSSASAHGRHMSKLCRNCREA